MRVISFMALLAEVITERTIRATLDRKVFPLVLTVLVIFAFVLLALVNIGAPVR